MSKELTLESVKQEAAQAHTDTKYADNFRMNARRAWWNHCEASRENHIPTFREFWNDEATYPLIA